MLKYSIEMAPLGTKYVVAAKDPEKGTVEQIFTLNETAAYMLKLFSEGLDAESVTNRLATEYSAPHELVKRDVAAFWEDLVLKGIV